MATSSTSSSLKPADDKPTINENPILQAYYASLESRIGYKLFLGGTRHFGYYDSERSWPFAVNASLRKMEGALLSALDLPAKSKVLDAGCGVGHVAMYMAQAGGLKVEAIDVVERHAQRAAANVAAAGLKENVHVQHGDYHNLDSLFEADLLDGLYTMETYVHATDPRAVARQFLRVLKPGGHLAMHEYEHADYENPAFQHSPEKKRAARAMSIVNKHAAMPANQAFNPGVVEQILNEEGFVDVKVKDISRNIWPMLWLFYIIALLPFKIFSLFGLEGRFVNTTAGYWSWKGRDSWSYIQITARKPEQRGQEAADGLRKRG